MALVTGVQNRLPIRNTDRVAESYKGSKRNQRIPENESIMKNPVPVEEGVRSGVVFAQLCFFSPGCAEADRLIKEAIHTIATSNRTAAVNSSRFMCSF